MTGRGDVAECYRRAVDWFCGGPGALDADFALEQQYGGILCRHLGYAYRLTGERGYLEVGRRASGPPGRVAGLERRPPESAARWA